MASNRAKWIGTGFAALVLAIAGVMGTHFEGTRNVAYQDLGGVWSICQGHTHGVQAGDTADDAQCLKYLQTDMGEAYGHIQRCITYPLTVAQAAAFTDAAYNLGPQVVCGSTLQRLANAGHLVEACNQLSRWVHVKGHDDPVQGLVKRRAAERALCIEGLQ